MQYTALSAVALENSTPDCQGAIFRSVRPQLGVRNVQHSVPSKLMNLATYTCK